MPPTRRKAKQRKVATTASRVKKIKSLSQWDAALEKAGSKKIVVVQFSQTSMWACKQLRPIFSRYSALSSFKKALFIEVDVDEASDVASHANIKRIPTYQCYFEGVLVDRVVIGTLQSYTGTAPSEMRDLIERNLATHCKASHMSIWMKLMGVAALFGGGIAVWMTQQQGHGTSSGDQTESTKEQILDIKQRIVIAQSRLKNMEKANRAKQARAQRTLIDQLNAQRRALERSQTAAAKGSQQGSSTDTSAIQDGKIHQMNFDDVARLRHKKRVGEVLYSDEEDVLSKIDG